MYRNTYSFSSGGSTWMVDIGSAAYTEKKLLQLDCYSLTWTVSSEDLLKMKLIQTPLAVQEPDKVITHHYININPPFLKNAIHSGVFYNELIKTCLWQTVDWILKLMSALETATNFFFQNLYPLIDSNILWTMSSDTNF